MLKVKKFIVFHLVFKSSTLLVITSFSYIEWKTCPDDIRSTSGFHIFLGANSFFHSLRNQTIIARSSTEAKYRDLAYITK